eukprot:Gb_18997 [translate_table: standard]
MNRQQSIHSFFTRPSQRQAPQPKQRADANANGNANTKQGSYTDMLNRREEKHLQFSQLKHKFAVPKESSRTIDCTVDRNLSALAEVEEITTPVRKNAGSSFSKAYFAKEESPFRVRQESPFVRIKQKLTMDKTPAHGEINTLGNEDGAPGQSSRLRSLNLCLSHQSANTVKASMPMADCTQVPLCGPQSSMELTVVPNLDFFISPLFIKIYLFLCRQNSSNVSRSTFEDQLNAVRSDAALDLCGPETPATRPLVPRVKRIHEDDSELIELQGLSPVSDPNKRRKLMEALGEDGLERGGTWEKVRSKFEFLDPSVIRDAKQRRPGDAFYDKRTLHIPNDVFNKMTPSQKQYWTTKSQYMDTILFFKVVSF